jgi:DNA gyrase subunit B
LFSSAIDEGTVFVTYEGEQIAGGDLRSLVEEAREVKIRIGRLAKHVPMAMLEQASISAALDPEILSDRARAQAAATYIAKRLDAIEPPEGRGWHGQPLADGGLEFSRTRRGVTERYVIDGALIESAEARRLNKNAANLQKEYAGHGTLTIKGKEYPITGPVSLVDLVMEVARKGIAIQRYKGLGEMNPDQLWETTLDPNVRTLLQVKVSHMDDAEDLFSTLMGDTVETRRDFIETNALKVVNLDV